MSEHIVIHRNVYGSAITQRRPDRDGQDAASVRSRADDLSEPVQMIPSRRNTGTLTKPNRNPKATAAARTEAVTASESACISNPPRASVEIMTMSPADATIIHLLGSDLHKWRRSRTQ